MDKANEQLARVAGAVLARAPVGHATSPATRDCRSWQTHLLRWGIRHVATWKLAHVGWAVTSVRHACDTWSEVLIWDCALNRLWLLANHHPGLSYWAPRHTLFACLFWLQPAKRCSWSPSGQLRPGYLSPLPRLRGISS